MYADPTSITGNLSNGMWMLERTLAAQRAQIHEMSTAMARMESLGNMLSSLAHDEYLAQLDKEAEGVTKSSGSSSGGSLLRRLWNKITGKGSSQAESTKTSANKDATATSGDGSIVIYGARLKEAIEDIAGVELVGTWNDEGTEFTVETYNVTDCTDGEFAGRLGEMIDSSIAIDVIEVESGVSRFEPEGTITLGGWSSTNLVNLVLISLDVTSDYDYPSKFSSYNAHGEPLFDRTASSLNEIVCHEFFGHAYDKAMGRLSDIPSVRETNAVSITNYYRAFHLDKPIRIYYDQETQLYFP
jgi:hypothetical protein